MMFRLPKREHDFRNPAYWRPRAQTVADNAREIDSDGNIFRFSYPLAVIESAASAAAAEFDEGRAIDAFASTLKAGAIPVLLNAELRTT